MKEICHFWEDHLKELGAGGEGFKTNGKDPSEEEKKDLADVKAGTLVAPNGWSPEHGPREDGVMHDQQLIAELFSNTIKAARILGKDAAWAKSLEGKLKRLAGNKIGKEGNLQEWMIDRIPKTDHRHTSHLLPFPRQPDQQAQDTQAGGSRPPFPGMARHDRRQPPFLDVAVAHGSVGPPGRGEQGS